MLTPTAYTSNTPSFPTGTTNNPFSQYASLLGEANRFAPRLPQTQLQTSQFPKYTQGVQGYLNMMQNPGITAISAQEIQAKREEEARAREVEMQGRIQQFSSNYSSNTNTEGITGFAKSMLGKPYVWGSSNPAKGVDCSGLTVNAAKAAGLKIPRTASAQLAWFKKQGRVTSLDRAKPGDLLYFRSEASPSGYHTGVYMGNGRMIHAAGTGQGVIQSKLGKWYTSRLLGVGIT